MQENRRYLNIIYAVIDALSIAGSYFLAWYLVFGRPGGTIGLSVELYVKDFIYILIGYLIIYKVYGLYRYKATDGISRTVRNIVLADSTGILIITFVLYLFRKKNNIFHFSSRMLAIFFVLCLIVSVIERLIVGRILAAVRQNPAHQRHIVLVGYSEACRNLIDAMRRNPEWGYHVDAILDDVTKSGTEYRGCRIEGDIDTIVKYLESKNIDEVAITLPLAAYEKLGSIVNICEKYGIHTKFVPEYFNIIHSKPVTDDMDGVPVINIRNVPLSNPLNAFIKRVEDIFFSIIFIILFSPIMIITSIAVKLSSRGPVLFKQERVGQHNKVFKMYKFRSMVQQKSEDEKKEWTTKNDPRVTTIGKFIRRTSIDELPQFFNVLFGKMSIVGPRPEREQFVKQFMEEVPRYNVKHQVRPGITGWAQVNGLRGDTSISERIKYDLYYIENWSLGFDLKIMFLTVFKGFINRNAY